MVFLYLLVLALMLVLVAFVLKNGTNMELYFVTHIVGGYVLMCFATCAQKLMENHYFTYGPFLKPFLGVIAFLVSYLSFSLVYAIYYSDYLPGHRRITKHLLRGMFLACLFNTIRKFHFLPLLLYCSMFVGMLLGVLCIILLKKKPAIRHFLIINTTSVYNIVRPDRLLNFLFALNPAIEEDNVGNENGAI